MSRCFPFPPPGYKLSSAREEALIESIKLQKEKQRKEEKRREKKERRKEGRERREKKRDKTYPNSVKSDIVKETNCFDPKYESSEKRRETESEKLEPSSLTEEHGLPDDTHAPSSSYDSTQSSNKRKRDSSTKDGSLGHCKAILKRLPSLKQSDFPEQFKGYTGLKDVPKPCNIAQGFNLMNSREDICSTSGQIEVVAQGKTGSRSNSKAVVNPMRGVELRYKDLMENWFPPEVQNTSLCTVVDLDWLFPYERRNRDVQEEKRWRCGGDNMVCSRTSGLWPRAQYLREVDAFALPFVVPY